MVEITHNILEEDFSKNQIHLYNLSVLLGANRLSYLVSDSQNKIVGLRSYWFGNSIQPIADLLKQDTIFNANYQTVKLGLVSTQIALVPTALFLEEEQRTYLEKVAEIKRTETLFFDTIPSLDIKLVYAVEQPYFEELKAAFPNLKTAHSSTGLIQNFVSNFDKSTDNIFINIYESTINITVVKKGKLVFHNTFTFQSSTDCLYFVLLVYQQLGLQPQKIPLYVVGELVVDSEIYKLLYKYIKTIKFVGFPNFYTFGTAIGEKLASNFFFDLYSLKLCE